MESRFQGSGSGLGSIRICIIDLKEYRLLLLTGSFVPGDKEGAGGAEVGSLLPRQRRGSARLQEGIHGAYREVQGCDKGGHAAPKGGEDC